MNITLKKLASRTLFSSLHRNFASASIGELLHKQVNTNDRRNAIRFENQGQTWDYHEVNEHSNAFALGLVELGYKPGDKLVFWFDRAQTSQIITAQIGAAKVGVSIVPVDVKNSSELESILKETEGRGLIISPNAKVSGDTKYIDVVNQAVPTLEKAYNGQPLKYDKLPKLKHVIHTGFYSVPGTLKYRHVLVYGNPNFVTSTLPKTAGNSVLFYLKKGGNYQSITHEQIQQKGEEFVKQNSIQRGDTLLVVGNVNSPSIFAYGVYNSLAHGAYVIASGSESFKDVLLKQRVQKSNYVLINDDKITAADVQAASLEDEAAAALKKVFVSSSLSNIPGLDKIFKKSVQKFDPLLI